MEWLWWVGAAVLFALIEVLSLTLVLVMFAGGALAAAGVALLGGSLPIQVGVFVVVSVLLLAALRPWLLRHLRRRTPLVETNAAAQVGRTATVVAPVTDHDGRVKLSGEVWSARTEDDGHMLPIGAEVQVIRIDGATAVVGPTLPDGPASP
jgi:membrane protein implicated in regulation of membrane protease activity